MLKIIENILKDQLVPYNKVYELAVREGLTKAQVKHAKVLLGIKTVTLVNADERLWLWYIPTNIWRRFKDSEDIR